MMRFIQYGLAVSIFTISPMLSALECEVSYKAKRTIIQKHLLREVSNPEYKAGTEVGIGKTLEACEQNALEPLRADNWTITYSEIKDK